MIYVSTSCLKGKDSRFTKDIFKVLEIYKERNIKNIEIGSVHSYVKELSRIKKYQKENDVNFIIHGFFPPAKRPFFMNFASKNKEILKNSIKIAKNAIELCNDLNSNLYSTHGGFFADIDSNMQVISKKINYKEAIKKTAESFKEICDYAANYNVKIAIENMCSKGMFGMISKTENFNDIFRRMDAKNLGILIDIGHLEVTEKLVGINKKELISNLKNKILEIHVHKSIDGKDTHQNISSVDLLKDFDKETLKKKILTLEATGLVPDEILKGKKIIGDALI